MTIPAGQFKQHCLRLMDRVSRTHEDIIITKRGKPVARLAPAAVGRRPKLLGYMKGQIQIKGNLLAPLNVRWTYDAGNL